MVIGHRYNAGLRIDQRVNCRPNLRTRSAVFPLVGLQVRIIVITACAVATSCCISNVSSQWEGWNFDPHSSHIFQPILMKLEIKKDIRDTTLHAKFGWPGTTGRGLHRECIFGDFCVLSLFTRKSSYCFQRILVIAVLSVRLSICHTGGPVKNGAR